MPRAAGRESRFIQTLMNKNRSNCSIFDPFILPWLNCTRRQPSWFGNIPKKFYQGGTVCGLAKTKPVTLQTHLIRLNSDSVKS